MRKSGARVFRRGGSARRFTGAQGVLPSEPRPWILPMLPAAIFVVGLLTGCALGGGPVVEAHADPVEAMRYAHDALTYEADPHGDWQTPRESLEKGTGDCEDYALLMLASLRAAGVSGELVVVQGENQRHAIVRVGEHYYDPTAGQMLGLRWWKAWSKVMEYSYAAALERARLSHLYIVIGS